MKWKTLRGKDINVNIFNYSIDWNKAAPSKGAQHVKDFIYKFCRYDMWAEELRIPQSRLRVDYVNFTKRFAIEFDGKQHNEYVPHFHGSPLGWLASIKRDDTKDKHLENNSIKLVRLIDSDLPLTKDFFSKNYEIFL